MPLNIEQKYPFRNTLTKYKLPARRFAKEIQARDVALEGYGFTEVINVLSLVFVSAKSLHLGLNGFDSNTKLSQLVDAIVRRHPYVLYVDLWGNPMGDVGIYEVLLKRSRNANHLWRNLRILNLNRSGLTSMGLAHTLRFLGQQCGSRVNNIRCLSLANNHFVQFPPSDYLRTVLQSLLVLDISDCDIGSSGAKSLGEFLQLNFSLRFLGVSFNNLGGFGMRKILEGVYSQIEFNRGAMKQYSYGGSLSYNRLGLQRLSMRGNGAMDRQCVATVFQILEACPLRGFHRLEYLDLRLNIVEQLLWAKFRSMAKDSKCDYHERRDVLHDVPDTAGIDNGCEYGVITGEVQGLELDSFILRPPTEYFTENNIQRNTLRESDICNRLNLTHIFAPYGDCRTLLTEENEIEEEGYLESDYITPSHSPSASVPPTTPAGKNMPVGAVGATRTEEGARTEEGVATGPGTNGVPPAEGPPPTAADPAVPPSTADATPTPAESQDAGTAKSHTVEDHADDLPRKAPKVTTQKSKYDTHMGTTPKPKSELPAWKGRVSVFNTKSEADIEKEKYMNIPVKGIDTSTVRSKLEFENLKAEYEANEKNKNPNEVLLGRMNRVLLGAELNGNRPQSGSSVAPSQSNYTASALGYTVSAAGNYGNRPASGQSGISGRPITPGNYSNAASNSAAHQMGGNGMGRPSTTPGGGTLRNSSLSTGNLLGMRMESQSINLVSPDIMENESPNLQQLGVDSLHKGQIRKPNDTFSGGVVEQMKNYSGEEYTVGITSELTGNLGISPRRSTFKNQWKRRQQLEGEFGNLQDRSLIGARSASMPIIDPLIKNDKIFFRGEPRYPSKRNVRNEIAEFDHINMLIEREGWHR